MGLPSKSILLGIVVGFIGLVLGLLPLGLSLEERIGLDLLFALRGVKQPPSDVVIVSLDKQSSDFLNLGNDYKKWPRHLHAQLVEILNREGAAVIVFDLLFDSSRSPEEDKAFADAIKKAGNVVLCCFLKTEKMAIAANGGTSIRTIQTVELAPPVHPISDCTAAIAPFPLPKVPYKVSQYWTFKQDAGDTPTLPVVAFQVYALDAVRDFLELIKRANRKDFRVPSLNNVMDGHTGELNKFIVETRGIFSSDHGLGQRLVEELQRFTSLQEKKQSIKKITSLIRLYQAPPSLYLSFYGPPRTITTIPYYEALQKYGTNSDSLKPLDFRGKAVFVGHSPRFQYEQKETFFTVFSEPDGLDLSGVEIAATGFANILEDAHVEPLNMAALGTFLAVWGLCIGFASRFFNTVRSIATIVVLSVLYFSIALSLFTNAGSWCPIVVPLFVQAPLAFFGAFVWRYMDANRERRDIEKTLDLLYIPKDLVGKLAKNISAFNIPHQLVYGICLSTDAERFTTMVDGKEPHEVADFLNKYFQVLFEPVKRYGGEISTVVGDSAMAIWVAPQPDTELRKKACTAALEISEAIAHFKHPSGLTLPPTRIGIHSGYILLGNVGALDHYEFRAIGDIVNTASRIEGINKHLKSRILASSETVNQLNGILMRDVGSFIPVGKSSALNLHELICRDNQATQEQIDGCFIFASALKDFHMRLWQEASEKFLESKKCFHGDGVSDFYIHRCRLYHQNPPGDLWDGTIRLEVK